MKKTLLFITFFSILSLVAAPKSLTASPSPTPKVSPKASANPSPSPSPTPTTAAQEDTAQKLRELIQKGTQRVKGAMDQVGIIPRGFIGEVQRVTDKTLTVKTLKDSNEILNDTPDVFVTRDNKKATIDDIAIGDWAVAIGTTDKEVFILKRLIISSTTLQPKNFITILATIKTIGKTSLTASTRNSTEIVTYTINKNTLYQDNQGNKIDVKTIKPEFQYLLVGYKDDTTNTLTTIRTLGN